MGEAFLLCGGRSQAAGRKVSTASRVDGKLNHRANSLIIESLPNFVYIGTS